MKLCLPLKSVERCSATADILRSLPEPNAFHTIEIHQKTYCVQLLTTLVLVRTNNIGCSTINFSVGAAFYAMGNSPRAVYV